MRPILFCFCLLASVFSIRFRERTQTNSYPNVHEMNIDISNNNTYKGRILNGSLIANDYSNVSFGFMPINFNNSPNKTKLRIDILDSTLTEEDYDNLYEAQTYSSKSSECNFNKKILLDRHNFLRAKHNASALRWDPFLEQRAKDKASYYEKMQCPKWRDAPKD